MASGPRAGQIASKAQSISDAPLIVGLFGGVASGKSRVGAMLAARGAKVLDADRMAHAELERPEVRDEVVALLGPEVRGPGGALDRAAIARAVFGDRARLARLEGIVHPRVMAEIGAEIERARAPEGGTRRVIVLDAPLLAEAGGMGLCDERLFVDAPREVRERRAAERGWAPGELERREARQRGLAEKRSEATFVIDNGGDLAATEARVDEFWRERIASRLG